MYIYVPSMIDKRFEFEKKKYYTILVIIRKNRLNDVLQTRRKDTLTSQRQKKTRARACVWERIAMIINEIRITEDI